MVNKVWNRPAPSMVAASSMVALTVSKNPYSTRMDRGRAEVVQASTSAV